MRYKNFFILLLVSMLSSSCALRSASTGLTGYQRAMLCYETRNYDEASRLFEEVLPSLQGKTEEASAYLYQAYCSFYQKRYVQSSEYFKFFHETFLGDSRVEEAVYMQGHALYLGSPDVKYDQILTQEAISTFHDYLSSYPEGEYRDKVSVQLRKLYNRLAIKAFYNAKLYHRLTHYKAAVVTLENLEKDFPTASCSEEAAYLKVDAQYRYLRKTKDPDQKNQLAIAMKYCKEFLDNYPTSSHTSAVEVVYENLLSVNKSKKAVKH